MSTLTLKLTNLQKEFIEAEVVKGGHGDAMHYIQSLIDKERDRAERLELDQSLREALRAPATEMTVVDWEEIRREGMRLIAEGNQP